jgi:hypothetical protein
MSTKSASVVATLTVTFITPGGSVVYKNSITQTLDCGPFATTTEIFGYMMTRVKTLADQAIGPRGISVSECAVMVEFFDMRPDRLPESWFTQS